MCFLFGRPPISIWNLTKLCPLLLNCICWTSKAISFPGRYGEMRISSNSLRDSATTTKTEMRCDMSGLRGYSSASCIRWPSKLIVSVPILHSMAWWSSQSSTLSSTSCPPIWKCSWITTSIRWSCAQCLECAGKRKVRSNSKISSVHMNKTTQTTKKCMMTSLGRYQSKEVDHLKINKMCPLTMLLRTTIRRFCLKLKDLFWKISQTGTTHPLTAMQILRDRTTLMHPSYCNPHSKISYHQISIKWEEKEWSAKAISLLKLPAHCYTHTMSLPCSNTKYLSNSP